MTTKKRKKRCKLNFQKASPYHELDCSSNRTRNRQLVRVQTNRRRLQRIRSRKLLPTTKPAFYLPKASPNPRQTELPLLGSSDADKLPYALRPLESINAKPTVSHSLVEKQRRDRINSLIDELRELVPPQEVQPGEPADVKRPKHIVLSDTISLLRRLMQNGTLDGSGFVKWEQGQEREGTSNVAGSSQGTFGEGSGDVQGKSSGMTLPLQETIFADGVTVEAGQGCLLIKINCKDRRGLLSDIITHLRRMPLEIKSAAVTTTAESCVMDVFEVVLDADSGLSAQDVQCNMQAFLYSSNLESSGDKRRRQDGET